MKTLLVDIANRPEPPWSAKVDRWYQLDEVCYAFCEALHQWNYLNGVAKPDAVFLALPEASNLADFDFVSTGSISPAKFVYTLPNISAALIFQMLGISGKIYCFHKGDETIAFALREAREMALGGKAVWVFSSVFDLESSRRQVGFQAF